MKAELKLFRDDGTLVSHDVVDLRGGAWMRVFDPPVVERDPVLDDEGVLYRSIKVEIERVPK